MDIEKYAPFAMHLVCELWTQNYAELNFECTEKGVLFNGVLMKGQFKVAVSGPTALVAVWARVDDDSKEEKSSGD